MDASGRIGVAGGSEARPADHGRLDRAEPLANPARIGEGVSRCVGFWTAGAAVVLCLALGGVPAVGQEASSSGTFELPVEYVHP